MAQPVLNAPRVVAGIRQRVAAGVPQHVGVNRAAPEAPILKMFERADWTLFRTVEGLQQKARPLRSSKLLRLPQRGQLGDGLRVVAGSVLASATTKILCRRFRGLGSSIVHS
jgi:hypothetical protein